MNNYRQNIENVYNGYLPLRTLIQEFESKKSRDCDYFCFVEGSSDRRFYSNINLKNDFDFFRDNKIEFIYAAMYKDGGKNSVLDAYNYIKNKEPNKYNLLKNKMIMIVDNDFNFGILSDKVNLSNDDLEYISVTKPYTIENYCFFDENLDLIFSKLCSTNEQKNYHLITFKNILKNYIEDIKDYYALKQTYSYFVKKYGFNIFDLKYNASSEQIITYDIYGNYIIDRDLLNSEINKLSNTLDSIDDIYYEEKETYYYEEALKYASTIEYAHGHSIFNLLKQYIYHKLNHYIVNEFDIAKNIFVDIDIKNIEGEKIN